MSSLTVRAAYGRQYKNRAQIVADWAAGKDFLICDISSLYDGKPVNKESTPGYTVFVRYGNDRKVCVINN